MDSNHRSLTTTDLQSVPFGHSGTPPRYTKTLTRSCRNRKKERDLHRPPESIDSGNMELFLFVTPKYGAGDGNRTRNLLITNQLLCQLSYASSRYGNLHRKDLLGKKKFLLSGVPRKQQKTCTQERKLCKVFFSRFFKKFSTARSGPHLSLCSAGLKTMLRQAGSLFRQSATSRTCRSGNGRTCGKPSGSG